MDIFITLQISLSKSLFLLDVVVVVAVGEEDEGVKIKTKLSLLYRLTCMFLVRTSSLPVNRPKVGAKHLYVHCTLSYLTYHNLK